MKARAALLLLTGMAGPAFAQQPPVGAAPPAQVQPRVEFVFEERAKLAPAVVLGETALGHRQYIPITGGTVAGPKLAGEIIPGGWDFQLRTANGCNTLTADYFVRASDGTVIHVLNEAFNCPAGSTAGERTLTHPRFEAPKGPHEWLTRGTFVGVLEVEPPATPPPAGTPPKLEAVRIRVYQIK